MIAINRQYQAPRAAESPTPDEIAKMTAQIRAKWSHRTRRVRAGLSPEGLTLTPVSFAQDPANDSPWFASLI
jgi:hypothetical protein